MKHILMSFLSLLPVILCAQNIELEVLSGTYTPLDHATRLNRTDTPLLNDSYILQLDSFHFQWGSKQYSRFYVDTDQTIFFEDECSSPNEVPPGIMAYNQIYTDRAHYFELTDTSYSSISYQIDETQSGKILKFQFEAMNCFWYSYYDNSFNTQIWLYENGQVDIIAGDYYLEEPDDWEFEFGFAPVTFLLFVDECKDPESELDIHYLYGDPANPKIYSLQEGDSVDTADIMTKTFLTGHMPENTIHRFYQRSSASKEIVQQIPMYKLQSNAITDQLIIDSKKQGKWSYEVYSLSGLRMIGESVSSNRHEVSCRNWPPGFYIAKFSDGYSQKFVKVK